MLGKRTRPVKLTQPVVSGGRYGYTESITSPKCSLEYRILSPRSSKNSDPIGGVGLGILAALVKKSGSENTQPMKIKVGRSTTNNRSNPIPISGTVKSQEAVDIDCTESYTRVTSRRPDKSFNKVYYDNGEIGGAGHDRSDCSDMTWKISGVFCVSPPRVEVAMGFPMLDFLSYCHLCTKKLHGKDIYMYRGEKAFCSTECRCRQIAMDECKEKCGTEVARSFDVSCSPYARENIFFTGVVAV